jgi:hypothetical protein
MEIENKITAEDSAQSELQDDGFKVVHSTECDHQGSYRLDGYTEGNLASVVCDKCWHGCMVDLNELSVIDGNLVRNTKTTR